MLSILLAIDFIQLVSIILILVLLFLGFRILETKWSYKISKPFKWENAVKSEMVSRQLIQLENNYRDKVRFYNLWLQLERLKRLNIKGDFAEVGVYKGETANIIHQADRSRNLRLFDTFSGFDNKDLQVESKADAKYNVSNFADTDLIKIKELFKNSDNVFIYPGYFPETTKDLKAEKYALVHLDADLYNPTIAGLHYFYPLLNPGGVIIVHDYNHNWNGINKAVDEFMLTIPESLIEITDWQGSVMIIKNQY